MRPRPTPPPFLPSSRTRPPGFHGEEVGAPADVDRRGRRRATDRAPDAALIRARGLTKRFGAFTAVDAIDFDVAQGESFGFLGPNGAGKTSTMRMIGCVSPVSDGELSVLGRDPRRDGPAIRARIGVVPQQDTLDTELTVRENLVIYGRYFGLSRAECAPPRGRAARVRPAHRAGRTTRSSRCRAA